MSKKRLVLVLIDLVVCLLQAEQLMKRIGVEGVKLTEYEMNIASHLVDPLSMKVTVGLCY